MNKTDSDYELRNTCPKCGDLMGEDIDGNPICGCSVPPRSEEEEIHRPYRSN